MSDKKGRRTIGDAHDETNFLMQELNDANAAATFTLSMRSYRGDLLSARCIKENLLQPITEAHPLERLELLENDSTNGENFFATDGGHATSDDFFKSAKIPVWEAEIKVLEDKKVGSALLKKYRKRVRLFLLW